ncbi:MAG: Ig-like domain-containing protein, partial [Patescibacteria group bacterium]|nr:Ig-like domain-containing protein [Patescibacteria group bacterium]
GDNLVTCSVSDAHSNLGTGTAHVIVQDTTPPVIENTPTDMTVVANATGGASNVTYVLPTATDIVDTSDPVVCSPASGSFFPLGGTTVTCNSQDAAGNHATPTSFVVTVVPGPISQLSLSADPTSTSTLGTITLTVTGKDQYGNVTTNDNSTVVALAADNGGALGSSLVTLIAGVAMTSLNNSNPGTVHVNATSGVLTPDSETVTFTAVDTNPPSVLSTNPAGGATGVAITAPLFINFDKALQSTSITSANIQLMQINEASTSPASDTVVTATLSLVSGDTQVELLPTSPLQYSTAYYFVVNGVMSSFGFPMTVAYNSHDNPFVTQDNTADVIAPTVLGQYPLPEASGVLSTVQPYVDFSEAMDATTLTDANVQLRLASDDSVIPATVVAANGSTRARLEPASPLTAGASYYIWVGTSVTDLAGNHLASAYGNSELSIFTIAPEDVQLAITQIGATQSFAQADDSFADGWHWTFNVTAPTNETQLSMKFGDFLSSGTSTIPAAGNIQFYSPQASDANSEGTAVGITAANTYSNPLTLSADLDPVTPGRQIQIKVEVKVPIGTPGGSYSTSYGIQTNPAD